MTRFTVFATPDQMNRPEWSVMDRNVKVAQKATKEEAQAECARRQAEADADSARLKARRVGWAV